MKRQTVIALLLCLSAIFYSTSLKLPVSAKIQSPDDIDILSHRGFTVFNDTYYVVVGEVKNEGNIPMKNVKLTATLYDSENEVIDTITGPAFLEVILPERKAPFTIMWLNQGEPDLVERYDLHVTSYEPYSAGKPEGLVILSSEWIFPTVSGEIMNIGDNVATKVKVVATFYDENDQVVAANTALYQAIGSGAEEVFEVDFPYVDENITMLAESGVLTAESEEYALKIPEEQNESSDLNFLILPIVTISAVALLITYLLTKKKRRPRKRVRIYEPLKSNNQRRSLERLLKHPEY